MFPCGDVEGSVGAFSEANLSFSCRAKKLHASALLRCRGELTEDSLEEASLFRAICSLGGDVFGGSLFFSTVGLIAPCYHIHYLIAKIAKCFIELYKN